MWESVYTLNLIRRGRRVPKVLRANVLLMRHAREVTYPNGLAQCRPKPRN